MPQPPLSPIDKLRAVLDEVEDERHRLMLLCILMVQKNGNNVVITRGELESIPNGMQLQQSAPTDVGFTLTTRQIQPR